MKVNINHPNFISFSNAISNNLDKSLKIDEYFHLPTESKLFICYSVFDMIKKIVQTKIELNDIELKNFLALLCEKNEKIEKYELAAVLNYIVKNYTTISNPSDMVKPHSRRIKKVETDSK